MGMNRKTGRGAKFLIVFVVMLYIFIPTLIIQIVKMIKYRKAK